jgi:hypothetical protein
MCAAADELGLTTPKSAKRRSRQLKKPSPKRRDAVARDELRAAQKKD